MATVGTKKKDSVAVYRAILQNEINSKRVMIDRKCFSKNSEEKKALKEAKKEFNSLSDSQKTKSREATAEALLQSLHQKTPRWGNLTVVYN